MQPELNTLPTNLVDVIAAKAAQYPEKTAFYDDTPQGWRAVSHQVFWSDVRGFAHELYARGINPGDRVGILARPCYAWEVADKATLMVGAINVGLDYKSAPQDLGYVIAHAEIRGLIVENAELLAYLPGDVREGLEFIYMIDGDPSAESDVDGLPQAVARHAEKPCPPNSAKSGDVATIIYTSGTTGSPKGIPLRHDQLMLNLPIMSEVFAKELAGEHSTLCWIPLYNGTGRMMSSINYHLNVEQYFVRDPMTLFDKIKPVAPSYLVLMPRITEKVYQSVMSRLAGQPAPMRALVHGALWMRRKMPFWPVTALLDAILLRKLREAIWGRRLKFLLSGSAPIDPDILRFFDGMGVVTYEVYGLSELSLLVSMNRHGRVRYGSVGEPLPTMEVKLAEDKEILVRGPAVLEHYWRDEQSDLIDADGYLKTGDLGDLRQGYLYIVGRKKEIIKTSTGQRISPVAVENVYRDVAGVEQLIVIGDKRKYLTALVVLDPKARSEMLSAGTDVQRYLENEFARRNHLLGANRQVKRLAVIDDAFTVENGLMTSTLKLRRARIQDAYQDVIERLYKD